MPKLDYLTPKNSNIHTMENLKYINLQAVSELLTGSPRAIRKNQIPMKYEGSIQELNDLIEYWKGRKDIKYKIEYSNRGIDPRR